MNRQQSIEHTLWDLIVVGGGMVGAATACRMAQAGLSVLVIEAQAPEPFTAEQPMDLRVSAVSPASVALLERCGAWAQVLAWRACPYRRLEAWEHDGISTCFSAQELKVPELGFIVENRLVQLALWQQLQAQPRVEFCVPARLASLSQQADQVVLGLEDGRQVRAKLVIGADGALSRTRSLAHIGLASRDYPQSCLLINVAIEGGQQDITWQHFTPNGPRAFLPLAGDQASLVWYDSPERVQALAAMPAELLQKEVETHFPARLPPCRVLQAGSFMLTRRHALTYRRGRVLLLGDAAHTIHPLAGQGVNLGFKDVCAFDELVGAALAAGRPWDSQRVLRAVEQHRRTDNQLMQSGMDGFHLIFSNRHWPVYLLRNLGLFAAERAGILKRRVLRYALGLD